MNIALMGYLMGMVLASFIYREALSVLSRGMKTAIFGILKTESALHFENTYIS
jgi:hypothetical protein